MLTGRKLLLADDSLTIQKVVSLTFNDEAMEVTTVGSGTEALEKLRESLPDIVLADVHMPEPNGYQLCERIKRNEQTRHLPVMLLVGVFEPFNEAEARRVGADDVLTKPFQSIRDLVNRVGGLLGGNSHAEEKLTFPDAPRRAEIDDTADAPLSINPDAAHNASALSNASQPTPADAFADYDMDDATIQTTHAAAFDTRETISAYSEINEEEQFSDRGEIEEAFVLTDDAPPVVAATEPAVFVPQPPSTAAAAPASAATESLPAAPSAFARHMANAAEADDALLELGDIAPAVQRDAAAPANDDDFILDIGDDDDALLFDSPAASDQRAADNDLLFADETPHDTAEATGDAEVLNESEETADPSAQFITGGDASPTLLAQDDAMTTPDIHGQADDASWGLETPAATERAPAEFESAFMLEPPSMSETAPVSESAPEMESALMLESAPVLERVTEDDSFAAAAPVEAERAGETVVAVETSPVLNEIAAEASPAHVEQGQAATAAAAAVTAAAMSPEMLDEIVRRVVAHMSQQVIREVAWEVVPDLAERLIKQRLEEESSRPPQ